MIENKILTRFRDGQTNCIFPHFPDSAGLLGVVVKMRKSEVGSQKWLELSRQRGLNLVPVRTNQFSALGPLRSRTPRPDGFANGNKRKRRTLTVESGEQSSSDLCRFYSYALLVQADLFTARRQMKSYLKACPVMTCGHLPDAF